MKPSVRVALSALCAVALATAARGDDDDPYHVPRDQFRAQVKRIALQPLRLPAHTPDAARLRSEIEGAITRALERRGYAVVPSSAFAEIWLRQANALDGVFDLATGKADPQKYEQAWKQTASELARAQSVDAVLSADVTFGGVPFYAGWFGYEAAGYRLRWQGHALGNLWRYDMPQRVEGPRLALLLRDPAYASLYETSLPLGWSRIYAYGGYEDAPPEEVYGDAAHDQEVVEALLGALLDRKAGDTAASP